VAKVAQSATATWRNPCHISKNVGSGTFFKQFLFCRDVFQIFFLQGRKSYLSQYLMKSCIT